jgi:hypothetical protein
MDSHPAVLNRCWSFVTEVAGSCCEKCGAMLTLYQPDVDQPSRLLGTCDECKSWYVCSRRPVGLVYIPLPEPQVLHA